MGEIVDYVSLYLRDPALIAEYADEIAMNLEFNIKKEAPYDQGRLRRAIRVDTRLFENYALITGYWDEGLAPHGIFVLLGTKPHPITFTNRWGTKTTVQHPGTKPNDFLGRGLSKTLEAYQ